MSFTVLVRKYPVRATVICFVLGGVAALQGVSRAGQKPAALPVAPPPRAVPTDGWWADLIVMKKVKPQGLDSEFSEYFVEETRKLPGVASVSESVIGVAYALRPDGKEDDTSILLQGWKPDNFGYERVTMTEGRKLRAEDTRKVILGRVLAESLKKNLGDKITFASDPDNPYEVVGIFKSRVVFEEGGAVVSLKDAQQVHDQKGKVTGFVVRVKKSAPASTTEVDAVKLKIEALRDPEDPAAQLVAEPPE